MDFQQSFFSCKKKKQVWIVGLEILKFRSAQVRILPKIINLIDNFFLEFYRNPSKNLKGFGLETH